MITTVRYSFALSDMDFPRIQSWLASTYWSPEISLERVTRGFTASTLVIGAFHGAKQIGVARALSDTTRFAYLADVFVESEYRGKGIGREMTRRLIEHSLLSDVDCCYLLTDNAHGVYEPLGFKIPETAGKLMHRKAQRYAKVDSPIKNQFPNKTDRGNG